MARGDAIPEEIEDADDRPTGRIAREELLRHTEATTPGAVLRTTLVMDAVAIEALRILSMKDEAELVAGEKDLQARRRRRSGGRGHRG